MVTVVGYAVRKNSDGKSFVALLLQGDLTMVLSELTGRFYATVRRCTVSSTFSEETAKALIGSILPGDIVKVETEPYDYTIEDTGEVIKLGHRWEYRPDDSESSMSPRKEVYAPLPTSTHSKNGAGQLVA